MRLFGEAKKIRNPVTITLASIAGLLMVLTTGEMLAELHVLHFNDFKKLICRCSIIALIVVALSQLVVVIWNRKSNAFSLIPLALYAFFAWLLGWRFSRMNGYPSIIRMEEDQNFFNWRFQLTFFLLLVLELAAMLFQIKFLAEENAKKRRWFISSLVVVGLYFVWIFVALSIEGFYNFYRYSTEIEFIFLMAVYIVWDYSFLEHKKKESLKTEPKKVAERTYRYFCPSCGARFGEGKKFCDQCGTALAELGQPEVRDEQFISAQDGPSIGVAILGFFVPLAGFIIWVSWNSTMPRKAKSAGKGALIGFITWVVLLVALEVLIWTLL